MNNIENQWEEELDRVEIIHCHHILHANKQADSLLPFIVLFYLMQITRLWKELMLHNSSCVWNARTIWNKDQLVNIFGKSVLKQSFGWCKLLCFYSICGFINLNLNMCNDETAFTLKSESV